jgi:hypothetical protein
VIDEGSEGGGVNVLFRGLRGKPTLGTSRLVRARRPVVDFLNWAVIDEPTRAFERSGCFLDHAPRFKPTRTGSD